MKEKGWSLVEILISLAIFSIISVVFVRAIFQTFRFWQQNSTYNELQNQSITALNFIEKELRSATQMVDASDNSIIFKAYAISKSQPPDQIRYFVQGNQLERGIIPPSGSPPDYTYNPDSETIKPIANFLVTDQPIFRYYDQSGRLLVAPVNKDAITLVEVTLRLDNDTTNPPPTVTVSTKVHLRNKKTNL